MPDGPDARHVGSIIDSLSVIADLRIETNWITRRV